MTLSTMTDLSPELMAKHQSWLRALVRRLVDDGQADDIVQEVWGEAMQAELRDQQALPGWLARVARRIAGKDARSRQRRRRHEQVAASQAPTRDAAAPSELVARVEERQQVARAVLELDEPFRTTVLLRYFEDQTPEQIAQRLNVPGATVRTRLHRAHERLRSRFEQERGRDWRGQLAAVVAPMAAFEGAATAPQAQPLTSSKTLLALVPVAAVAATVAWLALQITPNAPPSSANSRPSDRDAIASAPSPEQPEDRGTSASERTVAATDAPKPPVTHRAATIRITGQVVDYSGRPIPELEIAFAPDRPKRGGPQEQDLQLLGNSDRSGRFGFELPRAMGSLRVHRNFATLRSWIVTGQEASAGVDDALIVAAPLVQLSGRVVDQLGEAAANRRVSVAIEDTVGLALATAGTHLESWQIETRSDTWGNFELRNVPAFPFGELGVGRILTTDARIAIPTQDRHDLRLVLGTGQRVRPSATRRNAPPGRSFTIRGKAVTVAGEPIAAACAYAPAAGIETNATNDGRFVLSGNRATDVATTVLVTAPGYAPQSFEVWPQPGDRDVALTARMAPLDDASRAISGRLVDQNDRAVPGMLVVLADATQLDQGSLSPRFIECPTPNQHGPHSVSDSRGWFRISGVLDRQYQLRVIDESTCCAQTYGPFAPVQQLTVRIQRPAIRPEMQIEILDLAGAKVPGATVEMQVVKIHSVISGFSTSTFTSYVGATRSATSNDAGACRFSDAPGGDLRFTIKKPGFVPIQVDYRDRTNRLQVRLPRLVPFRVATHGMEDRSPILKLYDEAGNELDVRPAWRGNRYPTSHKFGVTRGHSVVAAFPETVRRAELRSLFGRELLRSMPVVVNYDGITVLDFPE